MFIKRKKIELKRELDETYFFLNITDEMSFATFQSFNLYFYRYDDDPIVNSIDN